MATSGTYAFTVTRDDLINSALHLIKALSARDIAVGALLANSAQNLNMLVKAMAMDGLLLWANQTVAIPLVQGTATYNIGPTSILPRPLKVLDAYLNDTTTGNDVSLAIISRFDYDLLGAKTTQGVPNQLFYDPQVGNGTVTFYNVPQDSTHTAYITIQRPIQDFNLATDNPDFPQEAFQMLRWSLAAELMPEYGNMEAMLKSMGPRAPELVVTNAKQYREQFMSFASQDSASTIFTPSERKY